MSHLLLSALINHLLTVVESLLADEEPVVVAALERELQLLVVKINQKLAAKTVV